MPFVARRVLRQGEPHNNLIQIDSIAERPHGTNHSMQSGERMKTKVFPHETAHLLGKPHVDPR
jgi:hypothetical protein